MTQTTQSNSLQLIHYNKLKYRCKIVAIATPEDSPYYNGRVVSFYHPNGKRVYGVIKGMRLDGKILVKYGECGFCLLIKKSILL